MTVGQQTASFQLDTQLTQAATNLRNLMTTLSNLNKQVNGAGNGTAYLVGAGYDAADAATFLNLLGYLNTVAGVYYGTVQQGGSGGTGAATFDFDTALAALWIS